MSRALRAPLAATALLLLAGCGGGDEETSSPTTPSSAVASSSTRPTPSASPTSSTGLELAVQICTDGISDPDTVLFDAVTAARNGTRTPPEIADAFQEAQDAIEDLSDQAEKSYPRLAQSLQTYADVLGRARVSGDTGLTEINDAREDINIACYMPDAPET